ncbi:MAG: amidase, partial [Actinobacteria bacterium]|nr:amidase [Actinomycetota bacterium]
MKSLLSAATLQLASGEVTSQELVRRALEVVDDHRAVEQRIEYAHVEAVEADSRRANGVLKSGIDGIPFGVKANIDIKDVVTTSGARSNEVQASEDSWIVSRLRELGAIPTLTTTMAEGALGAVTANAFTGLCSNPLDPRLNAGGSSGGSAAIVASEVLSFSLGSDTMGSVRIPAAYCEIVGYKPSRGKISNQGLVRLAEDFDSVGLLTTSVSD